MTLNTVFSSLGYEEQVYGNALLLYNPTNHRCAAIKIEKDIAEKMVFTVLPGHTFDSNKALVSTRNPGLAKIYAVRELEGR